MSESVNTMDGPDDTYELDELLGAYALDAVDPDEKARVEDYLRINPRAAAEVQQHREVATMLAFTGMDAPPDVWSRIENEIEGPTPEPGPELAKVLSLDADERERRRPVTTWLAGAAAAVALLFAGALLVTRDDTTSDDPLADAYAEAVADPASMRTELFAEGVPEPAVGVIGADGHGYLDAADVPNLGSGMTYQLWGVLAATGDVVSLGIVGPDPGLETFTVDGDVAALALTIENSPGVVSDGNPDGAYVGEFG